jgi:hypothetical protein
MLRRHGFGTGVPRAINKSQDPAPFSFARRALFEQRRAKIGQVAHDSHFLAQPDEACGRSPPTNSSALFVRL